MSFFTQKHKYYYEIDLSARATGPTRSGISPPIK